MGEKRIIESERLRVMIDDAGAELCSIYDKKEEREIMWQADPAYWKRHAPILFPNVGKTWKNRFCYEGQTYPTKQHGFARDMEFTYVTGNDEEAVHLLTSSDETLKEYPFEFGLEVTHKVQGNQVLVKWVIKNIGYRTMYCTIGGHPAFQVPAQNWEAKEEKGDSFENIQENYYLAFQKEKEELTYVILDPETGTAKTKEPEKMELSEGRCRIGTGRFDRDALIFDGGQIEKAQLAFPDGTPYVTMVCQGFPNFGIWQAPKAPFICLEPWWGRCDDYGFEGKIEEKPGIIEIEPWKTFEAFYTITIGE